MPNYSDALATSVLQIGFQSQFVAGDIFDFRNGTIPATPNTVATGTSLALSTLGASPYGTASGRAVVLATQTFTGQAAAGGGSVITWARQKKSTDTNTAVSTEKRQDFTVAGPATGTGTATASAGAVTFSSTQAGVVTVGSTITVAGVSYTVLTFNGTTGATVSGNPTFGASAFTTTAVADIILNNVNVSSGQSGTFTFTESL